MRISSTKSKKWASAYHQQNLKGGHVHINNMRVSKKSRSFACSYHHIKGAHMHIIKKTRQFICAPNIRSVKRDAARTRKISANSNLVHNLRSEFDPHRHLRAEQVE
jgi:hypothetical protein